MRKAIKILLIIFSVITIIVLGAFFMMKNNADKALASMVYEDVDMNQTTEGIYYGETKASMVYAKVAVTVENKAIKTIDIVEHKNGKGAIAESITDTIVVKNSYDVDAVSGATLSSESIKSAVSKALKDSCK